MGSMAPFYILSLESSTMKHHRGAKHQRGVTLVEMAIVIAAAMVLLGIGLAAWSRVDANTKSARLVSMVSSIDEAVRKRYPNSFNYTGLAVGTISEFLPGDVRPPACAPPCMGTNAIRSPFGGAITVAPGGGAGTFNIVIEAPLPLAACVDLVTQLGTQFWTIERAFAIKIQSLAAASPETITGGCGKVGAPLILTSV